MSAIGGRPLHDLQQFGAGRDHLPILHGHPLPPILDEQAVAHVQVGSLVGQKLWMQLLLLVFRKVGGLYLQHAEIPHLPCCKLSALYPKSESPATANRLVCYNPRKLSASSGTNNSLTLCSAISGGESPFHGASAFFSGGYSDSIGSQTASTRSVNRSPISRSVTSPLRCGKVLDELAEAEAIVVFADQPAHAVDALVERRSPLAQLRRRRVALCNPSAIASAASSPDFSASSTPEE